LVGRIGSAGAVLASGEINVSFEVTAERAYSYADAIIREGKEKMG
jgi:hypothetical protein